MPGGGGYELPACADLGLKAGKGHRKAMLWEAAQKSNCVQILLPEPLLFASVSSTVQ